MNSLAKSFDGCSESYEISRPGYPDKLAEFLKKNFSFNSSSKLLELAAGTGKFTDLLIDHDFTPLVAEWLPNMLEVLKSKHPKIPLVLAKAEMIPIKENIFEGVLIAQAFHWFANNIALNEIARVLKKNGHLFLIFQERNNQIEWVKEYEKIIFSYPHELVARCELGAWKSAFDNQDIFSSLEHKQFSYSQLFLKKNLTHRALGMSFIACLSEKMKKQVADQMKDLYLTHPQIKDKDVIEFPYITHVYWAKVLK